ncbi:ankyrin repeat domain-containing protein [Ralstonia sp. ASV6]|uniref:ankyrin repeat domain-containing protein n=1 Tax=Ralstonia sp. ASV6 TaxID=2795124 RepID=UPI0018EBB6E2|nr:ankyrin repeat domain-containing protein [Ralstonia sp. ASV6]
MSQVTRGDVLTADEVLEVLVDLGEDPDVNRVEAVRGLITGDPMAEGDRASGVRLAVTQARERLDAMSESNTVEVPAGEFSRIFTIPLEHMGRLREVIARLNKRAAKLGMPMITLEASEPKLAVFEKVHVYDGETRGERVELQACDVKVTGQKPVIAGHRIVGKLEHIPGADAPLVRGLDFPQSYMHCEPNCDHCQLNRQRVHTFVLQEVASGEYKQVGQSCLTDFFNGDDPHHQTAMLQLLVEMHDLIDELREPAYANGEDAKLPIERVLQAACAEVRVSGYRSKEKADQQMVMSTSDIVREHFAKRPIIKPEVVRPEDVEKAKKIIAWLRSEEVDALRASSTFMHNLSVLGSADDVADRHIGIVAAAVPSYDYQQRKAAERDSDRDSQFVGTVDEKIEHHPVVVIGRTVIPGDQYGDKTLYRFRDDAGNILVWFSTGGDVANVGDRVHLYATVKKHDVYRDVQQTSLLRVSTAENKLYDAVWTGKPASAVAKLAARPIEINQLHVGNGMNALMEAARGGRASVVSALLEAGADPNATDREGQTAAHYAAALGFANCLLVLEDFGADLTHESARGQTPYSLLEEDQAALLEDVRRYRTDEVDTEARVWQRDGEYPIKGMMTKKQATDLLTEEYAKHAANGLGDLRYELARTLPHFEVVIDTSSGAPVVLAGQNHIAYAISEGEKTIAALIGIAPAVSEPDSAPAAEVEAAAMGLA